VISGPAAAVPVTVHLPFHASFIGHWSTWGGDFVFHSSAGHHVQFQGFLMAPGFGQEVGRFDIETLNRAENFADIRPSGGAGAAVSYQFTQVSYHETPVTSDPSVGVFAGYLVDETLDVTGEIRLTMTVPTGVPLRLLLLMDLNSTCHSFFLAGAHGTTDGRETFGVPQEGIPVFDLPAGFTSNSTALGIVDNVVPAAPGDVVFTPRKPQGDWKNQPDTWPVTSLSLGSQTYSKTELLTILKTSTGNGGNADASLILADQLIAAKLNVANGSDPSIGASIAAADALLSRFTGKLTYRVKPSSAAGQQMTALATVLEHYNKNE
jgi:hypothetical protein